MKNGILRETVYAFHHTRVGTAYEAILKNVLDRVPEICIR